MARTAYPNIDRFRLLAAWMVVAIHTLPFASFGGAWDDVLTLTLGRVAVPFFFMTSGFFLFRGGFSDRESLARFCRRTAGIYAWAMLLYLPVNLYARQLRFPDVIGDILVDGTMYHLWYFPALILGAWLVALMLTRMGLRGTLLVSAVLYLFGLLGDSYWALTAVLPPLRSGYEALFSLVDHTRNGLFFAPIWLALGAWFSARGSHLPAMRVSVGGLALSLGALIAEGAALHRAGGMRHDSMYVALLPCMFFLFALLLTKRGDRRSAAARDVSMLVYLLHPAVILAVRGASEILGWEAWLIEQSMLHFLAVALLSFVGAWVLWLLGRRWGLSGSTRTTAARDGGTRVEVDLDALRHNARALAAELPQGCRLMAVVKAEAYGHGAVRVAQTLLRVGIRHFAVATVEEGIALRRAGIGGEILVLGYTAPTEARRLWRYRLTQTLIDAGHAAAMDAAGYPLRAHVKIDTGMHRLGVDARDLDAVAAVFACRRLKIVGMFTHLCISDELTPEAVAFTQMQIDRFERVREMLDKSGIGQGLTVHIQNSAGLLNYPSLSYHFARVGIALYGLHSDRQTAPRLRPDLRPVMSLRSSVALVREVAAGESVGYACAWRAEGARRIAVVPIGYADGVPRHYAAGGGEALLRGIRCPVIGRVCMDQLLIDVTALPEVGAGERVTLIGRDGGEEISAEEMAERCGTITNELLSRMGERPRRVYTEGKE